MKKDIRYIALGAFLLLSFLSACNGEEGWTDNGTPAGGYLQIEGEIVGTDVATTRFDTEDKLKITYTSFTDDDAIGFFSFHEPGCEYLVDRWTHQKLEPNVDEKRLQNVRLKYAGNKFTSEDIFNVTIGQLGVTFAYFPYSDKEEADYTFTDIQDPAKPDKEHRNYIHIFNEQGDVVDLLTATKRQYTDVNYQFKHQFAMLLIFLGEGFSPEGQEMENQERNALTVHLTKHVLGAHINRRWQAAYPFENFPLTVDALPLNEVTGDTPGYSAFTARRVDDYTLPEDKVNSPRTVYPVILPAGMEVDYITLKDITGQVQHVRPLDKLPVLAGGVKYPLTIKMTGIEPTIYPHEIILWNQQEEIKITEQAGIYDIEDFEAWLEKYNATEFTQVITEQTFKDLSQYGTYEPANGAGTPGHWTFYLCNNIDCASLTTETGYLIKEVNQYVTLDGRNYALQNLMLDFEHKKPSAEKIGLIGDITAGGRVQNLRLESPTVRNMNKDVPAGCLAGDITGGHVTGCTIREAAMMCKGGGLTGALAGSIAADGGTATEAEALVFDCKFHGTVQADSWLTEPEYKGVVGEKGEGAYIMQDCLNRLFVISN